MLKDLSSDQFNHLLREISSIYSSTQIDVHRKLNQSRTKAYWQIGKLIVTILQEDNVRADYGHSLMQKLSRELNAQFGSGFSLTSLNRMRKFYLSSPKKQPVAKFDWSKQSLLLSIEDKELKRKCEENIIKNNWSRRQIADLLKAEKIRKNTVTELKNNRKVGVNLKANKGILFNYRLIQTLTGELRIDCGFSIRKTFDFQKGLKDKDVVQVIRRNDRTLVEKVTNSVTRLYGFTAILERVVDGDTLICEIDCGFGIFIRQRVRLRAIDCPELKTVQGEAAKNFVQRNIHQGSPLRIRTHLVDKYDRPLADVWFGNDEIYLNQLLLDKGHARVW